METTTTARSNLPLLTELEVAAHFNLSIAERIQCEWPAIYRNFKSTLHGKFEVRDAVRAPYDLCLAVIALNLRWTYGFYSEEQANRIEHKVLDHLAQLKGWGTYAANEVKRYQKNYSDAINTLGLGPYGLNALACRLLRQWLGAASGDVDAIAGSTQIALAMRTLSRFSAFWFLIDLDFELVEGGSPFEFDVAGSDVTNSEKPRLFVVSDEPALLELIPTLLRETDCEVTSSLSLRNGEWAFEEVLADAIAFQPNALMFCINSHLCPLIEGVDIPRMLFQQFPDAKIIVTRSRDHLNIREDTKNAIQKQRRHLHVVDYPLDKEDLLAILWLDLNSSVN